jgi:hypothetical protein
MHALSRIRKSARFQTYNWSNTWHLDSDSSKKEIFASWALFILIMLLIVAFFTSYMMQQKKITAVHETVISIFAGTSWPETI